MKYLLFFYIFILCGCSPAESAEETIENDFNLSIDDSKTGIHNDFDVSFNINDPKTVVEVFKDDLGIKYDAEFSQAEFVDKIYDVYNLGENYTFVLNDNGSLRHINANYISENTVHKIFALIDFPYSTGFESIIDEYGTGETSMDTFTEYKGVGLSLIGHGQFLLDILDISHPYTMQIAYDEEHIEQRKDMEKKKLSE